VTRCFVKIHPIPPPYVTQKVATYTIASILNFNDLLILKTCPKRTIASKQTTKIG
jgi:hypothetical protein